MLLKRSKMVAAAGISLLLAVSFGFADFLIDDFNDRDNKNAIGTYWYFYDDTEAGTIGGTSEVTNAPFEDAGVNEDGVAVIEYTLGDSVDEGDYMLYPFVGMGFNFIGDGKKAGEQFDLTGATAISFDIWADKKTNVKFILETYDCTSDDKLHSIIEVGTTKKTVTVLLEIDKTLSNALKQEGWGKPKITEYDPTTNLKIAFQLRGHPNENPTFGKGTTGKLYVDNFTIVGPVKIKQWAELETVDLGTYTSNEGLLADFSEEEPTVNRLTGEWFIYNDADNDGTSNFTKGFDPDDEQKFLVDETGGANGTPGVSMAFELGPKLATADGDSILPYVGIGCNILKGGRKGYNAKADGATGLYLEYKSDIYVQVELEDSINRGSGKVYHAMLPSTEGEWVGVEIPFDSLKMPQWVNTVEDELATNSLKKIQFKLADGAIKEGTFAFDNLYFMGAKFTGVIQRNQRLVNNSIKVTQTGNILNVMFNNAKNAAGANVSLVNTMGRVVASKNISKETMSCSLPLSNNASGVYLLKISNVNGIAETAQIHIFRH